MYTFCKMFWSYNNLIKSYVNAIKYDKSFQNICRMTVFQQYASKYRMYYGGETLEGCIVNCELKIACFGLLLLKFRWLLIYTLKYICVWERTFKNFCVLIFLILLSLRKNLVR